MTCDKTQDLILTDYIDGRMSGSWKAELEAHLTSCRQCREFLSAARASVTDPFETLPREKMPSSITAAVLARIEEQQTNSFARWISHIRSGLAVLDFQYVPVRGFAAVVLVCVLMTGVGIGITGSRHARQQQDQVMFLAELSDNLSTTGSAGATYGTPLETYFLSNGGSI